MKARVGLMVILVAWPVFALGGWESETVMSEGSVGSACSLAVDRWGRPHITYKDVTNAKIMYAYYNGSNWSFQTVYEDAANVTNTAVALNAFGNPCAAFGDDAAGELVYAYRSGSTWKTEAVETVGSSTTVGKEISITAWPSDPKIAYNYGSGGSVRLKYAYKDGDDWVNETVATGPEITSISVFVDNDAYPNVVFYSGETASVNHGLRDEEWTVNEVAEGMDCHGVLGPDGKAHICFAGKGNDGIVYATSNGGNWQLEDVTDVEGKPGFTRICVNSAGNVFISYFNWATMDLHIMTRSGGAWSHELVAAGSYVGLPHSIALGSAGYPLIAYYDGDDSDLKLARYDPLSDIEVKSFTANRLRDGVRLEWSVERESEVAGFNLYRASTGADSSSPRAKLNGRLITGKSPFGYLDGAAAGSGYNYWLEVVSVKGVAKEYGPVEVGAASGIAKSFALAQSYPNPARDTATFSFALPESCDVRLDVYDLSGRLVATPAAGTYGDGAHDVAWNLDSEGRKVPPGVYLYTLRAGSYAATKKLVVAR